jgi:hypothetical protein
MSFPLALSERSQSLARTLKKRMSVNKASEVAQLQPVALAGASNKFRGPSQIYTAFATKRCAPVSTIQSPRNGPGEEAGESDCQYVLLAGEPAAPRHGGNTTSGEEVRACRMCAQAFLQSHTSAHRYPEFCSLDCKSAFLLGANVYSGDDESEGSTVSASSESAECPPGSDSSTDIKANARRPRRQWV